MLLKAGVDISRLNRQIRRILSVISDLFSSDGNELIVTSTFEGTHSAGSLHYCHDAFDCRYPAIDRNVVKAAVKSKVPDDFDVVFHDTHIHIEYDP